MNHFIHLPTGEMFRWGWDFQGLWDLMLPSERKSIVFIPDGL